MIGPTIPNIFTYATEELFQDSVLCWLIEWSATKANDKEEQALRNLGRSFVGGLLGKHDVALTGNIQRVEIYRQDNGIDVLTRIGDEHLEHVILIEDKTDSQAHGDQLQRYRSAVTEGSTKLGKVHRHYPIYLKTGNQSLAEGREVEEAGYIAFSREDLLTVLTDYPGSHPIVTDFRDYLRNLEDDFRTYEDWREGDDRQNWSWAGWEGFCRRLEAELEGERGVSGGHYVPNPSGGFLGFSWSPVDTGDQTAFYLLLEIYPGKPDRQKLCFKVCPGEEHSKMRARDFYETWFQPCGREFIEKPQRFGAGGNMTVGWWKGEWLRFDSDGKLDFRGTVRNLRMAQSVLVEAHAASCIAVNT